MSSASYLGTNFSAGEVSDYIDARVDVAKRFNAARVIENYWLLPEGGAVRRPGLLHVGEVKDSTKYTRLIPFEYNTEDAFFLEFGHQYIRFIKNREYIEVASVPYEIASPYNEADLRDLHYEQSADFLFITSLRDDLDIKQLARVADDDWVLSDFGADPPPSFEADESLGVDGAPSANTGVAAKWRSNGDVFLAGDVGRQIVVGAGKAIITALDTARQVTINIFNSPGATITAGPNTLTSSGTTVTSTAHGAAAGNYCVLSSGAESGEIRRIQTITNANVFEIDEAFSVDQAAPVTWNKVLQFAAGEWLLRLSPQTTIDVDKKEPVGATVTIVMGTPSLRAAYVGMYVSLYGGLIRITGVTDPSNGAGIILSALEDSALANPAVAAAGSWQLRSSSWSTTFGRPRTLAIHGGRMVFGGTITQPNTIWGSSINSIYNFAVGALADSAYEYTVQGGGQNPIQWLVSLIALYIGDAKREYSAKGQGVDNPIGGDQIPYVAKISNAGSMHIQPVVVDNAILLTQRFGHDTVILAYSLNESPDASSFVPSEPCLFARHLGDMEFSLHPPAYARRPYSIVFYGLNNGHLAGLTFKPRQEVLGFSRSVTSGSFESYAVVPHEDGKRLTICVIVKRTIDGNVKRFVEVFEEDHPDLQERISDGVVWAGLQTDSAKLGLISAGATTIIGLPHLAGADVDVIIGDSYIGQKTVDAGGEITLTVDEAPAADTTFEVGFHYDSTVETIRPAIPGEVTEGFKRMWPIVFVRVKNSIGGTINGKALKRQQGGARMYTGLLKMENLETADPYDGSLTIVQSEPYPFEILNISGKVQFADDMA